MTGNAPPGANEPAGRRSNLLEVGMSNDYRLDEAKDDYVEACADEIAARAAKLVASRDMDRKETLVQILE